MKMQKFQASITEKNEVIDAYLKEVAKFKMLAPGEENELRETILHFGERAQARSARKRLAEGNLRFVISVAKQYQNSGLELMDLINEGNYGLVKASTLFDPSKNVRFISFAVWWIRQAIMEALKEKRRLVRFQYLRIMK